MHGVAIEQRGGALRVAMRERVHDLAVLAGGDGEAVGAVGKRLPPVEVQLVHQAPVHREQCRVAGELRHAIVEAQVERVVVLHAPRARRLLHLLQQLAQLGHLRGGDALGKEAADQLVQAGPHFIDVVGFLHRYLAHEHAAILLGAHQALALERAERLAHRPARHVEAPGNLLLVQLVAWGEVAREDAMLEVALHQRRKRVALQ